MLSIAIRERISSSSSKLFEQDFAYKTLLHIIRVLYNQGAYRDVSRLIQTYEIKDLECLVPTLPKTYAFQNYEAWLDHVEDIDHREEIELWVRRVSRGSLSEAEFDQRVAQLLVDH